MKRIALIDMDGLVYKCGFASECKLWTANGDGFNIKFSRGTSLVEAKQIIKEHVDADVSFTHELEVQPIEIALGRVKYKLKDIFDNTKIDSYWGFLGTPDDKEMFRYKIAKTLEYKGNRKDMKKPWHYNNIRQYLIDNYKTIVVSGIEADDAISIAANKIRSKGDIPVVCSFDKDLNQIEGEHYDFAKNETFTIKKREAIQQLYTQCLTGDRADNIPGLKKVGPKTASKMLSECETEKDMFEACQEAYKEYYAEKDWQGYLKEQMNLVYLLKEKDTHWSAPL